MATRLGQLCLGVDSIERGNLAMAGSKGNRCRGNKRPAEMPVCIEKMKVYENQHKTSCTDYGNGRRHERRCFRGGQRSQGG